MGIEATSALETDWDKLINIFASKFSENEWNEIVNSTPSCTTRIEEVPGDTLRVLISLFGAERGVRWLYYDRTYRNEPIIDFLRTYADKKLAVKAVNARVSKLYNQNQNDSFLNNLKSNYRNTNWDEYISDLQILGFYSECDYHIDNVDQSVVNIVFSSALSIEQKKEFFNTPIYELHGMTPIELSQNAEGKECLKLYLYYVGIIKSGDAVGI